MNQGENSNVNKSETAKFAIKKLLALHKCLFFHITRIIMRFSDIPINAIGTIIPVFITISAVGFTIHIGFGYGIRDVFC